MKVFLPSSSLRGIPPFIEVPEPRINDLRDVGNLTEYEEFAKNEFLYKFADISKITIFDRDYLFMVLVSSLYMNSMGFKVKCECGKRIYDKFEIDNGTEFHILEPGEQLPLLMPTVEEEMSVLNEASLYSDAFEDVYWEGMRKIVGAETKLELVCFLKKYFHGVLPTKLVRCECGKEYNVKLSMVAALKRFNLYDLMSKYNSVKEFMDFRSFTEMTLQELKAIS